MTISVTSARRRSPRGMPDADKALDAELGVQRARPDPPRDAGASAPGRRDGAGAPASGDGEA